MKLEIESNPSIEDLDKLTDVLTHNEATYVFLKKQSAHLPELKKRIAGTVSSTVKIVEDLTERQYYEQKIEIYNGLTVVFRTGSPGIHDECYDYAMRKSDGKDPAFTRLLAMRKLAYGIVSINDRAVGPSHPKESYVNIMTADPKFYDTLREDADKRMNVLNVNPLAEKLKEVYLVWEQAITEKINGEGNVEEALKK